MKTLPTRWDLISRLKGKRVLDIGGVGYCKDPIRQKLFSDAWDGVDQTTMDINKGADIVVDFNKKPLPKIKGKYDVAVLFDVLEHLKYPMEVLEWLAVDECWINLPCASPWMQMIECEAQKTVPGFQHLYGWTMLAGENFIKEAGWTILESQYLFDYQSWRGKLFSQIVVSSFPSLMSMGVFFRCTKRRGRKLP